MRKKYEAQKKELVAATPAGASRCVDRAPSPVLRCGHDPYVLVGITWYCLVPSLAFLTAAPARCAGELKSTLEAFRKKWPGPERTAQKAYKEAAWRPQAEKFELSDLHLELIAEYEAAERSPGAKSTAAAVSGGCGLRCRRLLLRTPVSLARP